VRLLVASILAIATLSPDGDRYAYTADAWTEAWTLRFFGR
jgi:hypothetical protein